MHKHVQRCCLLLSFLAIFTILKAQEPLPPPLPDCEDVQLSAADNELTISGLIAPISLVKIYDDAFNLVFECNGNCEETLIIENLNTCQTYHVEGIFFSTNYEEICTFQEDILINGQIDGTTVCKGDVRLDNQAAVDAFCGCEIITGNLIFGADGSDNDITDISNLSGVQSIEGTFFVRGTKLTNLSVLNIEKVFQGIDIEANSLLTSINIFNELERTNSIKIRLNPQLQQINGFQNLKRVEGLIIGGNENLTEITAFGALELIYNLNFSDNSAIKQLNSFPELATSTAQVTIRQNQALESMNFPKLKETAIVIIQDNPNLTTVGKFDNLNISFFLNVQGNLALTDCCFLTDLVDDDFDNGYVGGTITIKDNGVMCNTIEEILENCEGTPPTPCDDSICQGDVILNTQAEVDAFCGCEIIEGELLIGYLPDGNDLTSDIHTLQGLEQLKQVKGQLRISRTQLSNLDGLTAIEKVEGFSLIENELIENVHSLKQLTEIKYQFSSIKNFKLTDITGLSNLRKLSVIRIIETGIEDLSALQSLEVTSLISLDFTGCPNLRSLAGLENITSYRELGGVRFIGNPLLEDISALKNCELIDGNLTFVDNRSMTGCCDIAHLVDKNLDNGVITGNITLLNNPNFCRSVEDIIVKCENLPNYNCADIALSSENNQLTISGITAPNSIVKVFDKNYQLVFECNGDCEETIQINNLNTGEIYYTDIQFYTANWESICDDKQDIEILGGDPCDDSICQGDVILNTQAEVDAFCGCEVIEGNLIIGAAPPNNALNDIISIQNLISTKQIKGNLTIVETQLTDLDGLENLKEINSSAAFVGNAKLISFKGLDNLMTVEDNFSILDNAQLVDLDGLKSLSIVNLQLQIQGNSSLISISALSKINQVEWLSLISNNSLKSLDGLEGLDSIFTSPQNPVSGVLIAGNDSLIDISSLQNLKYVATDFTLSTNDALEDCCSITHLMDEDLANGQILGAVNIGNNPAFCSSVEEILARCNGIPPVFCDNINIITGNNDLIIEGITAPNSIVKVFDNDWQLAFECNGDCEEIISLSDLTAGDIYHTDIQFYDANWQAICSDRQDIEILGGDPCDDSICQGDVVLSTQAEVDEFCGCETIEGRLLIGLALPNGVPADITSLANLHQLKSVKGGLLVVSTSLTNLEGLEGLIESGEEVGIVGNAQLISLKGLNNLESVNTNFTLLDNPVLENVDALESLVVINGQLSVNTNSKLTSIKGFSKITSASFVNIFANQSLSTLEGLENLETIKLLPSGSGGLLIVGNAILADISSLQGIKLVEGPFELVGNAILEDCCAIAHLIDEDETNGQVLGDVFFSSNPAFCNSVAEILAKCGAPSLFSCDNINIAYANNELNIIGLTAPRAIVKVFDEDWQQIFDCFNDCETAITLSNLSGNTFHIRIANYDEDWNFLCHGDEDLTVAGSRNINDLLPKDFTLSPNPAYEETTIDLNRLLGETVDLKMYNQFGQDVFEKHIEKVGTSSEKIDLSTIANGFYLLKIQAKGKRPIAKKLLISRLY